MNQWHPLEAVPCIRVCAVLQEVLYHVEVVHLDGPDERSTAHTLLLSHVLSFHFALTAVVRQQLPEVHHHIREAVLVVQSAQGAECAIDLAACDEKEKAKVIVNAKCDGESVKVNAEIECKKLRMQMTK